MSYQAVVYRVLVSTPSDVITDINTVKEAIDTWNIINSVTTKKYLDVIHWKSHSYAEVGSSPQKIINKQIVDDADIIIALFWTRLGTKTEDFASGTVEEIEESISSGKKVLIYFSKRPVLMESVDVDQYKRVKEYMDDIKTRTLFFEYADKQELYENIIRHIGQTINTDEIIEESKIDEEKGSITEFRNQLSRFYRKSLIDWSTEEKTEPVDTDNAKWIIKNVTDQLIEYQSMIAQDKDGELTEQFENAITKCKMLQQHRMYIDGGQSYKEFWDMGNLVFTLIKGIIDLLEKEISSS